MSGFVYIFSRADGLLKIGVSTNPNVRAQAVSHAVGETVAIVAAFPHDSPYQVEGAVHRTLVKHRTRGEWFRVSVEAAEAVIRRALSSVSQEPAAEMPKPIEPWWPTPDLLLIGFAAKDNRHTEVRKLMMANVGQERIFVDDIGAAFRRCREGNTLVVCKHERVSPRDVEILGSRGIEFRVIE